MKRLPIVVLLLIFATPALAEPGPPPREVRFDLDGDPLPDGAIARLGSTRYREIHATRLAFSPDGKRAVCSDDVSVRTWDLATGRLLTAEPLAPRFAGAVSADGSLAVRLHHAYTDWPAKPAGGLGADVWAVRTGRRVHVLPPTPEHSPQFVAISADRSTLATVAGDDKECVVRVWDVRTGRGRDVGRFPVRFVNVAFVDDGRGLLVWSRGEPPVYGFDLTRGERAFAVESSGCWPAKDDGRFFLGHTEADGYRLFDAATGMVVEARPPSDEAGTGRPLALSNDGRRLAFPLNDDLIVWDLRAGRALCRVPADPVAAAFGPRGELLFTTADGLHLVDPETGRRLAGADPARALSSVPGAFGWLPDGHTLSATDGEVEKRIWFDATGKVVRWVRAKRLPPPGRVPGCCWPNKAGLAEDWAPPDARGMRERYVGWQGRVGGLIAVRLEEGVDRYGHGLPDRFRIEDDCQVPHFEVLMGVLPRPGPKVVTVQEYYSHTPFWSLAFDMAVDMAVSPDLRRVASLEHDRIRLWDVETKRELLCRRLPDTISPPTDRPGGLGMCFSPDGRRLAVANWDGTILIWDVAVPGPAPKPFGEGELDRLWAHLASPEGKTGWRAVVRLLDHPAGAAAFLSERVRRNRTPDPAVARRLLADLDSPAYRVREKAAAEVLALGDAGRTFVAESLKTATGAEVRQRLESLRAQLAASDRPAVRVRPVQADLQVLRAVAVLEAAATADARVRLRDLASDGLRRPASCAAMNALERLARPEESPPKD